MRVYYIFSIKKETYEMTKKSPESLYKILESIKNLNKEEASTGFKMFDHICSKIDKKNINKLIKDINIDNLSYMSFNYTHTINDFLNNEIYKLELFNSYIKISSNAMYPSFFKSLIGVPYLFVCDFNNMDYFFLRNVEINSLAR